MTLYLYLCETHIRCIVKTWCNEHDCINDFMINNIYYFNMIVLTKCNLLTSSIVCD